MFHSPAEFRLLGLISPREARSARDNLGLRGYRDLLAHLLEEVSFDWRHGVRTRTRVSQDDLGFEDKDAQHKSERYRPTPPYCIDRAFAWLAADLGGLDDHCLVDYGCGAGVVLLTGLKWKFDEVIGLELSPALVRQCQDNLNRFSRRLRPARRFRVLQENAAYFAPPPNATVFYFFHPFSGEYFDLAMSRIRASVREHPRDIHVVLFQSDGFNVAGLSQICFITGVSIYSNRDCPETFMAQG